MPIEVLITVPFTDPQLSKLWGVSPRFKLSVYPAGKTSDIPADVWARTEVLYTGHILPTPEQAPALRWIQFHVAGVDRFVAEPVFGRENLIITTLSGAAASQVAEHALAMMLALGRKIPAMMQSQKKNEWPKDRFERFSPVELRGSTVGIVGYGSIGRQLARLLQPFGATILASKRNAKQPQDDGYCPDGLGDPAGDLVHRIYPGTALRSMLRTCNFVVVAAPLTPQTRGMLNAEVFSALKPGTLLVDVSRGGVVDLVALQQALKDGKLAGASLDVFPEEPLPANSPLWQLPNVIISPHISGGSVYYNDRAAVLFAENLHRYLGGLPLYNIFNGSRGY